MSKGPRSQLEEAMLCAVDIKNTSRNPQAPKTLREGNLSLVS